MITKARLQGYHVYGEVIVSAAAASSAKRLSDLAGIVLNPADSKPEQIEQAVSLLRSAYPRLPVRVLNPKARQPDMKGQMVVKQDGVLQVSSPTAQPWVDTNLALVRLEQIFRPAQTPLYEFQWDLSDPLLQEHGLDAANYELAIAEAGAFRSGLVLNLDPILQSGLLRNDAAAWATLKGVKPYLDFVARTDSAGAKPEANVAVVTDSAQSSYEAINLLARHNIPFEVLSASSLKDLDAFDVLLVLVKPNESLAASISDFASRGGVTVLVNSPGAFPWQSSPPLPSAEHSAAYAVGKGRVIELREPVIDPEPFAQDIRRLIDNEKILISLWNALTTVAVSYRLPDGGKVVELVNYSQESLAVQVRVKGSFASIRYETPETGCCQVLTPVLENGFTEFVAPALRIAARVDLSPGAAASQKHTEGK